MCGFSEEEPQEKQLLDSANEGPTIGQRHMESLWV